MAHDWWRKPAPDLPPDERRIKLRELYERCKSMDNSPEIDDYFQGFWGYSKMVRITPEQLQKLLEGSLDEYGKGSLRGVVFHVIDCDSPDELGDSEISVDLSD